MNKQIGISYARTFKEIDRWKEFSRDLGIELVTADITLDDAVKLANGVFRYSKEYCYTRKATLGEYLWLWEHGVRELLVVSRYVKGNNPCNTTRYLAAQLYEYLPDVHIIDVQIEKETEDKVLVEFAKKYSNDNTSVKNALQTWHDYKPKKKNKVQLLKDKPNILFLGGAPFLFSYTNKNTYMTNFLLRLGVNLVGPKDFLELQESQERLKGLERISGVEYIGEDFQECFWPREKIMASIYQLKNRIDGVILVRDKYCMGKMEEVDFFKKIIDKENIPSIVVDYRSEAIYSTMTLLETFVEMIKWREKE